MVMVKTGMPYLGYCSFELKNRAEVRPLLYQVTEIRHLHIGRLPKLAVDKDTVMMESLLAFKRQVRMASLLICKGCSTPVKETRAYAFRLK